MAEGNCHWLNARLLLFNDAKNVSLPEIRFFCLCLFRFFLLQFFALSLKVENINGHCGHTLDGV